MRAWVVMELCVISVRVHARTKIKLWLRNGSRFQVQANFLTFLAIEASDFRTRKTASHLMWFREIHGNKFTDFCYNFQT